MGDLEVNLCVYFAAMITKMLVQEIAMVYFTRKQISSELHGTGAHKRDYSYIEVQAKSPQYSEAMQMDDWTELVVAYAFLACFNVVLPAIAPIAFLASLVRYRCMAYRNISILRRPVPAGAPGIGIWAALCEIISIIAVIVNCAFAVFAMKPVRTFNPTTQWMIFVASQYVMFLLKLLIRDKFLKLLGISRICRGLVQRWSAKSSLTLRRMSSTYNEKNHVRLTLDLGPSRTA